MDGGTWIFKGKRAGEHLKKLNSSHEKALDSINPCAVCRRALADHKGKS
jgi:cytidine deaminase